MWKGRSRAGVTGIKSLAVLSFDNLSSDPDQDYFVAGMQDALINELSQVRALRVISRTSAARYKNSSKSLPEIARELNVDVILEGSVFRDGDSVRVQVQLIRPLPQERPVWTRAYDRDLRDVLALHSDIARTIAREIKVNLTAQEETRLAATRRVTPDAYEAYLRGMHHLNKFTPEGYEKGLRYLHEAIEKDPADPLPYAGLALGYSLIGHGPEPQAFRRTKSLALKALEIDDTLAEAHESVAEIEFYREWNYGEAERSFQRALELNPNLAAARAHYSWCLLVLGRKDEAIAEMKRAEEIDPLKPLYPAWLGWIYWWVGEYDRGIEAARKSLDLDSDFQWGHYVLGAVYAQKGMYREAIEAHRKAAAVSPTLKWALGHTLAKAGRKDEARKIAAELKEKVTPMNAWGLAEIYAALGEKDEAFRWLDSAIDLRFSWLPGIALNPPYEPLRGDPRFEEWMRRLDLPQ
jgi:TolB-like protein/Tfp pilus assembly protein PilF